MPAKKKSLGAKRFLPDQFRSNVRVCVMGSPRVPRGSKGIILPFDERFWNGYTIPVQCFDGKTRAFTPGELRVEDETQ